MTFMIIHKDLITKGLKYLVSLPKHTKRKTMRSKNPKYPLSLCVKGIHAPRSIVGKTMSP